MNIYEGKGKNRILSYLYLHTNPSFGTKCSPDISTFLSRSYIYTRQTNLSVEKIDQEDQSIS